MKSKKEITDALVASRRILSEYKRMIQENKRPDWREERIKSQKEFERQVGILEWALNFYDNREWKSMGWGIDLIVRNTPADRKNWDKACDCPEHNGIHPYPNNGCGPIKGDE